MKRFLIFTAALALAACASDQTKKVDPATAITEAEPSPVGVIPTALIHDAQRNKDVDVAIAYPTRGGPYPLIVFSHGYGATPRTYEALASYWTSRGYVTVRPAHADAGALRQAVRETVTERRDQRRERRRNSQPPPKPQFRPNPAESIWDKEREPQWRDRVRDITLVLDSLDDLEQRFPELKGKMDHAKIGVGGHSYGAFTAMLVAGARAFGNPPLQLADPRVKAIVAMSPPGITADRGLSAESFRDTRVPAMFMTGSRDYGALETEGPEWRRQAFENSPPGDKYFVLIEGARHTSFTGAFTPQEADYFPQQAPMYDPRTGMEITPAPVPNRETGTFYSERGAFDRIRSLSLSFWDAYLKNDSKARENLKPIAPGGGTTIEVK